MVAGTFTLAPARRCADTRPHPTATAPRRLAIAARDHTEENTVFSSQWKTQAQRKTCALGAPRRAARRAGTSRWGPPGAPVLTNYTYTRIGNRGSGYLTTTQGLPLAAAARPRCRQPQVRLHLRRASPADPGLALDPLGACSRTNPKLASGTLPNAFRTERCNRPAPHPGQCWI